MTRTVFDNSMTAHVWAQRSQNSGKSGNGNFYFEGPFLYSYGSHFLVGYALPDGRALLNGDRYSVSTSGHQSYASRAVRGRAYDVPNLTEFRDVLEGAERAARHPARDQLAAEKAARVARAAALISREGVKLAKGKTLNPNARRPDFSAFSAEAAAVIFEALGLPPAKAARAAAKALKARETNRAQWIKAEKDSKTQAALDLAKETAARPLSETLAQLHQLERSGRLNARYDGPRKESEARQLFAAAKVAKSKGLAKVAAAVMAHYRLIRERVKLWPEIEGPAAVRAELRGAFRAIRAALPLLSMTPAELGEAESSRAWHEKPDRLARDARAQLAALGLISAEGAKPVASRAKALGRYLAAVGIPESVTAARAVELAKALGAAGDRALLADVRRANRERVAAIRALRAALANDPTPGNVPTEAPAAVIRAGAKALRDIAHNLTAGNDVMPWKAGRWTAEGARAEYQAAEALLAAAETREAEEAEAQLAAWAEARKAAWLAGQPEPARPDSVYAYSSRVRYAAARMDDGKGGALIRARDVIRDASGMITGGTLETSQGAEVPLMHAIRAFCFLKLCREKGQGWRANGKTLPVGHFRVDHVDAEGNFRAGCHTINWGEVARLAAQLGLDQLAAENTTEPTRGAA